MTALIAFIITVAALLGAVKGLVDFYEWWQRRQEEEEQDE